MRPDAILVRHGETEWTISGQHTGRTDVPLTEAGRQQAKLLGGVLGALVTDEPFALVLTSPLSRAMETCQLAGLGDEIQARDDLREWDYGDYEGRRTADIRETRPGWLLWTDGVPGGETISEVAARTDRVIAEIRAASGPVAVFAHGHLLRVLAARWLEVDPSFGGRLALNPASVSRLAWEREQPVIDLWNTRAHLSP